MRKVRKSHAKHGRIELTLMALIVVATAFTGAHAALPAFTGHTHSWVAADWADYNDVENWRVDDPSTGATVVPGANDLIYLN